MSAFLLINVSALFKGQTQALPKYAAPVNICQLVTILTQPTAITGFLYAKIVLSAEVSKQNSSVNNFSVSSHSL